MAKHLHKDWVNMGILETIEISKFPLEINPNLLVTAACFWSKTSNTFVLPYGMISPTILDVVHMTGLPSTGLDVNALLTPDPYEPLFELDIKGASYKYWLVDRYVEKSMKPSLHEKISFYVFLICKFLMAIPGFKVTREYINLVVCLAQGKKLALAPFVLGTLYKDMYTFVDKKVSDACGGPFWFFQAWLAVCLFSKN